MNRVGVIVIASLLLAGCGGGSAGRLTVYPTTGKISMAGGPLVGAVVTFVSSEGKPSAIGRTDEQGVYHLTTYEAQDGAAAGNFSVVLALIQPSSSSPASTDESHAAGVNDPLPSNSHSGKGQTGDNVLPEMYTSAASTPFHAEVKSGGDNAFDFELK